MPMEIYWTLQSVKKNQDSVLTVGTFDGVHLGHQFILRELRERAAARGAQTTLVTFEPHPQLVLHSPGKPSIQILTTIDEKIDILQKLALDRLVVIEFTREFANTSSEAFVENILFNAIGFHEIVIGYDHAFGKNREGDITTLKKMSTKLGFRVAELSAYHIDNTVASSTYIRDLLKAGKVKAASKYLGRNYSLTGTVTRGDGRGKTLQFPTANIALDSNYKLMPRDGVYAVFARIGEERVKGMMNIGMRPTFDSLVHVLEVHIFEFNREIYGEKLTVEFVDRIRDEIRFTNADELVKQLDRDKSKSLLLL